jgi:hypothetical protein
MGKGKIKAGYLYLKEYYGTETTYAVCIGKVVSASTVYQFVEFMEVVPNRATLKTYPLSCLTTKVVEINMLGFSDLGRLTCLGKVIEEPTEQEIKKWITQLKLSGYSIEGSFNDKVILGDWRKRKRLRCATNFGVGKCYVDEELGYCRTKRPYNDDDIIWYYAGRDGDSYIWLEIYYKDYRRVDGQIAYKRHTTSTQHKNMVLFKVNSEGYQVEG